MAKCYIFPGQGSQAVGMGKDLYDNNPAARAAFDEIDDALGEKLSDLIFSGPAEKLDLTENVQPAIFAVSIAMWRAGRGAGASAGDYVAGHSMGEYSALAAAGAIGVPDCARLLRRRGKLMQSAVPAGVGAMGVIIGDVSADDVCAEAARETGGSAEPANDNGGGQIVISGNKETVEKALEIAKASGAKIAKMLAVSVPAHSGLMEPIVREMRAEIEKINWKSPALRFISNKTAGVLTDVGEIRDALVYQLTHGVRWRESVLNMPGLGINEVAEVGPGSILTGLVGRVAPELKPRETGE